MVQMLQICTGGQHAAEAKGVEGIAGLEGAHQIHRVHLRGGGGGREIDTCIPWFGRHG
jgi:hypothetical protein